MKKPDTTKCQARNCPERREVLLTRNSDGASAEYCRAHAQARGSNYEGEWNRGYTPESLIPGLGICPRCGRFVKNGARHGYTMSWNGGDAACEE